MSRAAFAFAVAVVVVAGVAPSAFAADRNYIVLSCHLYNRQAPDVEVEAQGAYRAANNCAGPSRDLEVTVDGQGLPGQAGYFRYTAPDNTSIVGVSVEANLRRDNRHRAQLAVVDYAGNATVLLNGGESGTGFIPYENPNLNALRFVMQLICSDPGGCGPSAEAHAYMRDIRLVLADRVDPAVTLLDGSLFDGGWLRGSADLQAQAADLGSGLVDLTAYVNGVGAGRIAGNCPGSLGGGAASAYLLPCSPVPTSTQLTRSMNTSSSPFHEGANEVNVCATDFAGNGPICESRSVTVDNEPPSLSFQPTQDRADPELIRVSTKDPHSGVEPSSARIAYRAVGASEWLELPTRLAGDEMLARVDSGALPPGDYEFMASATDLAGNSATTASRPDGEAMVLTFPLRASVQLVARVGRGDSPSETIGYGRDSKASGRLLDENGEPMPRRQVTVTEHFGRGALIDQRVRTVLTSTRGRWSSKLPAGPSRTVDVSFAGNPRYQPLTTAARHLHVRSRSSFETSRDRIREGRTIEFSGKVGHFGAHIPSGGKLVELQVREGRARWNTVREAFHTDSSGRFRLRYRFGTFYESNARFVFRVKVAREQGWPYKAPGRSRSQEVTVVADR